MAALVEQPRRLLVLTVLVLGWLSMPLGFDDYEARYVDQALSIERRGALDINPYQGDTIDKSKVGENYYPTAAPGPSFLAVPAVWLADRAYGLLPEGTRRSLAERVARSSSQAARLKGADIDPARFLVVMNAVCGLVCVPLAAVLAVGLWRLLRLSSPEGGEASTAVLAICILFGTHVVFYLGRLFSHAAAACAMTWAFVLLGRWRRGALGGAALAGALSASLLLFEYPLAISAVILGLSAAWILRSARPLLAFAAGASVPATILAAYHWTLFGGPFTPAHRYYAGGDVHASGLYGVHTPSVAGFLRVLFSPYRGLFVYSFLLLPALVGGVMVARRWRPRSLWMAASCVCAAQLTVIASYAGWTGGAAWGARFLTATVPLLGLGLAPLWEGRARPAIASLAAVGMLVNGLAAASRPDDLGLDRAFPMGSMLGAVLRRGLSLPLFDRLGSMIHVEVSSAPVQILIGALLGSVVAGLWLLWRRAMALDARAGERPLCAAGAA